MAANVAHRSGNGAIASDALKNPITMNQFDRIYNVSPGSKSGI